MKNLRFLYGIAAFAKDIKRFYFRNPVAVSLDEPLLFYIEEFSWIVKRYIHRRRGFTLPPSAFKPWLPVLQSIKIPAGYSSREIGNVDLPRQIDTKRDFPVPVAIPPPIIPYPLIEGSPEIQKILLILIGEH
jgi:hypothetical protein